MFKFLDSLTTFSEVPICRNCKHHATDQHSRHICVRDTVTQTDPVTGWTTLLGSFSCASERKPRFINLFACGESGFYFEPKEESK